MADIKKIATRQAYGEFLKEYGAEREDLIVMSAKNFLRDSSNQAFQSRICSLRLQGSHIQVM